ncbi:hypothetical protein [Nocardioides rubriscoriae]|uniref:hypothetical protein n=1 Tax=Nocardioides rubriscoriae TaxID=642762 RepID=UPI0011DF341A|nr:hypothetical protein [Nocardioides rubriscoriae]
MDPREARSILTSGDRLDGFVNFAYRALNSDRDGRPLERRLDSAEAVAWLLDTVFVMEGRVRPYNKYLAWELHEHPLAPGSPHAPQAVREPPDPAFPIAGKVACSPPGRPHVQSTGTTTSSVKNCVR